MSELRHAEFVLPLDAIFAALSTSEFRRRFHLAPSERAYLRTHGLDAVLVQAEDLIARRLAPAQPLNDGKQTPFRGHPVFVAQHATATCCRGCLAKWHDVPRGAALTDEQQAHVIAVLERWLRTELDRAARGSQ
jgi:predicted Fe-S protein YdhL (DUF1289 family)